VSGNTLTMLKIRSLKLSRIYAFMGDASLKRRFESGGNLVFKRFLSINPESKDAAAVSKKLQGLMPTPAPVDEPSVAKERSW